MTNYEKIKNMSIEQMTEAIDDLSIKCGDRNSCDDCVMCYDGCCGPSTIRKWLESEADLIT